MPRINSSSHNFSPLPLWFVTAHRTTKVKTKASGFLKHVAALLMSIVKAKSLAVKKKTSALKTRLIIFGLLHNKEMLISTISDKIHALVTQEKEDSTITTGDSNRKTTVLYHAAPQVTPQECTEMAELGWGEHVIEVEGHPDLRHSFFHDEHGQDDGAASVIDLVKNSRREDDGEFILEDHIDHVAELFIRRFHRQLRMQELE